MSTVLKDNIDSLKKVVVTTLRSLKMQMPPLFEKDFSH